MSTKTKGGPIRGGTKRHLIRRSRYLTEDEKREIARELVALRNIKTVARNRHLAYITVYKIFRSRIVVTWELASTEAVQLDFFGQLPG